MNESQRDRLAALHLVWGILAVTTTIHLTALVAQFISDYDATFLSWLCNAASFWCMTQHSRLIHFG